MLVLTRKSGESIKIGEDIEITIVSIKGDQIKLGINAPKDVQVLRKEVYDLTILENKQASQDISSILSLLKKNKKNY